MTQWGNLFREQKICFISQKRVYLNGTTHTGVSEMLSQIYFINKFHEIKRILFGMYVIIVSVILRSTPSQFATEISMYIAPI